MAKRDERAAQAPEDKPEPTAEEQREQLKAAQGETTSPQAEQQQERDAAEPSGDAPADVSALSADEQAARAAHHAEGGGAWPPELLAERGVRPGQPLDAAALYEQQAAEADES